MATATLDRPQRYSAQDDGEFVVFEDIPVFKEHRADDGFYYGKQELAWICHNVNERIRKSGDFTPVCVCHTSDPGEDKNDPPVIGFAGPFHLRKFTDEEPIWCIAGNFRIFKDDEGTFRRHPRRSVELWVEEDPRDRFFDPISVLGAETPRLDLGMVYSRKSPTRLIRRYQAMPIDKCQAAPVAAFPSGSNTFVPSTGRKKKQAHDKEPSEVALSPDDVKQIVEALQATSEFQFVRELMKSSGGAEGDDDSDGDGGQDGGEPSADLPQSGSQDDPEKKAVELMKKYAAEGNDAEFGKVYDGLDDDAKKKCMAYALGEADESVDDEPVPAVEDEGKKEADKMNFRKALTEAMNKNKSASVPLSKFAMLERDHNDLKKSHANLKAEIHKAKEDTAREKRRATRYSRLCDMEAKGILVEPAEEIDSVVDMTDEQFELHATKIARKYQRIGSDNLNRALVHSTPAERLDKTDKLSKQNERSEKAKQRAIDKGYSGKTAYAKAMSEILAEETALNGKA